MTLDLAALHHQYRDQVISEWVDRLKTRTGMQYARRPREELLQTVSGAFDGNYRAIVENNFSYIDRFIDKITEMRLEAGFPLSDVQKAFEAYRTLMLPILAAERDKAAFVEDLKKINACLAYTIHRFSDHFQGMHERQILAHNRRLEEEVAARTNALQISEQKYKTLVEEINDGYFVIRDQSIVFANKAFCRMHGYLLSEVLGKRFHVFVDPCDREKVKEFHDKGLRKDAVSRVFEYLRLTREGERYPTEILAKNVRYENRHSFIGICRDITERVKMEQRVREAQRMAYIGQITTSLSHEIRNPLSSIKMNLQILRKRPGLTGNDQRRMDISINEVMRLEHILRELLDFAKPLQMRFQQIGVNHILSSCAELLEAKSMERGVRLVPKLAPEHPWIWADREKLEQAFLNLMLNAVEASPEGGRIQVKSRVITEVQGPQVAVEIADEGPGVAEALTGEIFKPFFTTKSKGTGLGLSNVRRIADAHGGRVDYQSGTPKGARFRVFLPLEPVRT